MKSQFDNLPSLFERYSKTLPETIQQGKELEPLTKVLPLCPYRIVGAVGNEIARNPFFESSGPHPKRLDMDFIVPFTRCSPDEWQEIVKASEGSNDFVYWDNGNIMVLLGYGTISILNPAKYNQLSPEACQLEVAKVFYSQIDPNHANLHTVDTGEATIFVGQDIVKYPNPKDDKYPGVYGDVYPMVFEAHQPEAKALFARGYLPQNGYATIMPNGEFFNLPVDLHTHPLPDLDISYLSRSPQHAIQFLRRFTKSTINLFGHRKFFDELPEQLTYFSKIYSKVAADYVEPYLKDPNLKDGLESLQRKIKKLRKTIAKENSRRSQFHLLQQLEIDLS